MTNHPSSDKSSATNQEGDVDLLLLLARIVRIIRKRLPLFFILILAGLAFGSTGYFVFKPVYKTKMIAQSRVLTSVEIKEIIDNLDALIEDKNAEELSKRLKMDLKTAKKIKELEVFTIKDLDKDFAQKEKDSVFVVAAKVTDNQVIQNLQKGIIDYLNENDFSKKRIELYKAANNALLQKVQWEAKKLDSLKTTVKKLLDSGESKSIFFDPGSIYFQSIELYRKELEIKEKIALADEIQVIQNFTRFKKPSSFSLLKSMAAGAGGAVLLWILLIIVLELRLSLQKVELEKV